MKDYLNALSESFELNSNKEIAEKQSKYMRYKFEYYGIMTPLRKEIMKPFLLKASLPDKKELTSLIKTLWGKPQRDYQYFALNLLQKYQKQIEKKDIILFEHLIINKSWWDTIDSISPNMVGAYIKQFPEERSQIIDKWLASDNIWLQRSCILFQLKYKNEVDTEYLEYVINRLLGSKEFFINKAIGWMLRQYAYTNPDWVIAFAERTELSNLSRREALRVVLKKKA